MRTPPLLRGRRNDRVNSGTLWRRRTSRGGRARLVGPRVAPNDDLAAPRARFGGRYQLSVRAPRCRTRPPIRVHTRCGARPILSSRWFAVGWMVAILAWGLHVGALSLAALSVVQAVISGGLVFLAVFAVRYFGSRLGRSVTG